MSMSHSDDKTTPSARDETDRSTNDEASKKRTTRWAFNFFVAMIILALAEGLGMAVWQSF